MCLLYFLEVSQTNELLEEKEADLKESIKKHEELKQKTKSIENEKKTTEKDVLGGKKRIEDLEKGYINTIDPPKV